ncbi:MAG TPA: BON domain-containing protein [Gemmatimonadaceae bacterium]
MSPLRYRDDDSSSGMLIPILAGALAGFAAGVLVSKRMGGLSGMRQRLARLRGDEGSLYRHDAEVGEFWSDEEDDFADLDEDRDVALEERVLEAYRNDPIMSERAVDIGSLGPGVIELSGAVESEAESEHAVVLARGVPGVSTVVNRVTIGELEEELEEGTRRAREGNTNPRWEGIRVGTGRRRQGTSDEFDRHADPAVELEDRWLDTAHGIKDAVDDIDEIAAERRQKKTARPRGDRTGGSPIAPTGVPKADHVAEPLEAPQSHNP